MVSPLVDLARGQVEEIKRSGLSAASFDTDSLEEARVKQIPVYEQMKRGELSVVVAGPERLTAKTFRTALRAARAYVGLYIIDEAHVVGPWSRDFREDYNEVPHVVSRLRPNIPVIAMTATLSREAEHQLVRKLGWAPGTYVVHP
ncbi:unnamed protein product [Peniophora sp. CBMAI 1063]|nr:unnamed protein product [Peniophora sp. CBMAI 1063]